MSMTNLVTFLVFSSLGANPPGEITEFISRHCVECHSGPKPSGSLDLANLPLETGKPSTWSRWVKIHDRIESGEMPPKKEQQPARDEKARLLQSLKSTLVKAELERLNKEPRTGIRRLTRSEYENTMRDLFDMPGILLQDDLPADGSAHGFDNNSDALDISHVNLSKYLEAADKVLDLAICTQPAPPVRKVQRVTMANEGSTLGACILEGDGVMLKNKKPDPNYPPAGFQRHIDYGAHLSLGMHSDTSPGTSVGLFRHEDDSFRPSFVEFTAIYPGRYRIRTNLWSFNWDKGQVLPAQKAETVRLDVWHITGDGRGTGHPSSLLGYFDALPNEGKKVEIDRWLNNADSFGINFTTSHIGHEIRGTKGRLMAWKGPGIACDGLEIDGPIFDHWPTVSHQRLFGALPITPFDTEKNKGIKPPRHREWTQRFNAKNHPDPSPHTLRLHAVSSSDPQQDARRLLSAFLPRAFRRPVAEELLQAYLSLVDRRLKEGDCFELAMRWAYRAALCSPDFLYRLDEDKPGNPGQIDDYSLASRLSYFLWNSMPDDRLTTLAGEKKLHQPGVLKEETERMLKDPKAQRFRDDFVGQWLKLRKIAANDPDPKLYGGWRVDLQDAMVAETRGYFRELLEKDLPARYVVKSEFAMLNERLAKHYGIQGVEGCQVRRVSLAGDSPRGPFLTQAAILKVTANGTTTSPVPRGAFVLDRLLGQPPEPPPANVAAVEPDVRGTTTIREQLAKHRDNSSCASCHARIDPPGFALEAFDVIGGQRTRYQSITDKKPPVDPSGVLADGRPFRDILQFQEMLVGESDRLSRNLAERFAVYSLGRGLTFSDRDAISQIVRKTNESKGGMRTLIHELVQSDLFRAR